MSLYMHVSACINVHVVACVGGSTFCVRSQTAPEGHLLARLLPSELQGFACLCLFRAGMTFHMSLGDLTSASHVYVTSAMQVEPSPPQLLKSGCCEAA